MYVSNSLHIASEGVAEFQARSQKKVCFPLFVTHHQAGGTTRQISLSLSLSTYIYIYISSLSLDLSLSRSRSLSRGQGALTPLEFQDQIWTARRGSKTGSGRERE